MCTLILSGIILMIVFRFIKKCRPSKGDPFIQHLYYIGEIISGILSSIFFVLMILGMDYVASPLVLLFGLGFFILSRKQFIYKKY